MSDPELLLIESPAEGVRRIALNRPEKRNALDNALRRELFAALASHDRDPQVCCTIFCGAGKCDLVYVAEGAKIGFANRSFPAAELPERFLEIAERLARIPPDLQQLNKRSVHRGMEIMGIRAALAAGSELQALATHQKSVRAVIENALASVKSASSE